MNQAETQFIFDLQLFTEGEAPTQTAEPTVEPNAQEPSAHAATELDSDIDYSAFGNATADEQLVLLKKHGFYGNQEPPTEPKQDTQQEPVSQPQQEPTEPQYYMPEEVASIGIDKLDPSKLPIELVPYYKSMQADYTRKSQDVATQRKQFEAYMAAQVQPQAQQPDPLKQTEQEYQAVATHVEKELGLNPGEFSPFDPIHQFAFNRVTMQYNSQKLAQHAVETRVNTFIQQAQQDPVSVQVDANFDSYIYKMGAEGPEGVQKANALLIAKQKLFNNTASMRDIDLLEGHWNAVKAALSAPKPAKPTPIQQQKPKQEPLKTESPGSSVESPRVHMDYKKLGNMKQSDQLQALREAGFFKRDKTN